MFNLNIEQYEYSMSHKKIHCPDYYLDVRSFFSIYAIHMGLVYRQRDWIYSLYC